VADFAGTFKKIPTHFPKVTGSYSTIYEAGSGIDARVTCNNRQKDNEPMTDL
jgi:hypothetical protein